MFQLLIVAQMWDNHKAVSVSISIATFSNREDAENSLARVNNIGRHNEHLDLEAIRLY